LDANKDENLISELASTDEILVDEKGAPGPSTLYVKLRRTVGFAANFIPRKNTVHLF
jgi:hypothetical protein